MLCWSLGAEGSNERVREESFFSTRELPPLTDDVGSPPFNFSLFFRLTSDKVTVPSLPAMASLIIAVKSGVKNPFNMSIEALFDMLYLLEPKSVTRRYLLTNSDTYIYNSPPPFFQEEPASPGNEVEDQVQFLINNLSSSNMDEKLAQAKRVFVKDIFPWVANLIVKGRVSTQANFHSLYMDFLDKLGDKSLLLQVSFCFFLCLSDSLSVSIEDMMSSTVSFGGALIMAIWCYTGAKL
jgi:hypothetical protein